MNDETGPGIGARFLLLSACALLLACSGPEPPDLPELPVVVLDDFLPRVQQQIGDATAIVENDPGNGAEAGRLGMIYQSYNLHRAAIACYARARLLEPGVFQWAYLQALAASEVGEAGTAIDALAAALQLDPGHELARLKLAGLLLSRGDLEDSLANYERLIADDPSLPGAHLGAAQALMRQDDLSGALDFLEAVIGISPENAEAHYALAQAYRRQGEADMAARHMALHEKYQGLEQSVSDPLLESVSQMNVSDRSHIARGQSYAETGQVELAIAEYEKALELNPRSGFAHTPLLRLYGSMGNMAKAESHYRSAVELNPGDAQPHYFFGMLWLNQGDYEKAAIALGDAASVNPQNSTIQAQLGLALERLGDLRQADKHYQQALVNAPRDRDANYLAARAALSIHNAAEARERLQATLQPQDQKTPRFLALMAAVDAWLENEQAASRHFEQGLVLRNSAGLGRQVGAPRLNQAKQAFETALASDRASVEFPLQLGLMLDQLGNADDARMHFREAVKRGPQHREANFLLARSLMALGRHEEAIPHLNMNINPDNPMTPTILGVLATAFAETGETDKALETLEYAAWLAGSHGDHNLAKTLNWQARRIQYITPNPVPE
jgi:tetratricopeptide (TPR) repeat protein